VRGGRLSTAEVSELSLHVGVIVATCATCSRVNVNAGVQARHINYGFCVQVWLAGGLHSAASEANCAIRQLSACTEIEPMPSSAAVAVPQSQKARHGPASPRARDLVLGPPPSLEGSEDRQERTRSTGTTEPSSLHARASVITSCSEKSIPACVSATYN
jgi:hypothetical protein